MTSNPSANADVVVVGGGVIGLAIAWELHRRGRRPLVLEGAVCGAGASQAAGGMLAPICEAEHLSGELLTLALESRELWPDFAREIRAASQLDLGYDDTGTLAVALDRDDAAELEHLAGTLAAKGLPVRRASGLELRRLEPRLSPRVVGGLVLASDHQVDPRAATASLTAALRSAALQVLEGHAVHAVQARAGQVIGVEIRESDGDPRYLNCETVVVATGAHPGGLPRLPLAVPPAIRPVKGQLVRLRGERLLRHVIRAPRAYLVPRGDGTLLVGATCEVVGFDDRPTAGAMLDLLRGAFEIVPAIYELELEGLAHGWRPAFDDHLPRIGETECRGLFVATGHYRNGVLLAPATARHLADWIVSGRCPEALAPFRPHPTPSKVPLDVGNRR